MLSFRGQYPFFKNGNALTERFSLYLDEVRGDEEKIAAAQEVNL